MADGIRFRVQSIKILYGTETDTALELAETLGEALDAEDIQNAVVDMQDFDAAELASERLIVVITSTYGNGDPPYNARALLEALQDDAMKRLDHLRFVVLGLGDSTYTNFCQCGKDFDARLGELGAQRILERRDVDGEAEEAFEDWKAQVVPVLRAALSSI